MAGRRAQARPPLPRSRHFLRSRSLAAAIVAGADISSRDLVVDIGAGSGRLTAELARVARRVVAIELDLGSPPACAAAGRTSTSSRATRSRCRSPTSRSASSRTSRSHTRATLLHRSSTILALPLVRADLIVEWGVAVKRGLPAPSSVSGILWGAFHELRVERKLPAAAFDPPPACDAGVLVATRRARPLIAPDELPAYRRFVADAFRRGRRVGGALPRDLDAHQWAERYARNAATGSRTSAGARRSGW